MSVSECLRELECVRAYVFVCVCVGGVGWGGWGVEGSPPTHDLHVASVV